MRLRPSLWLVLFMDRLAMAFECFRNTPAFDYEVQYCNPRQSPFCLKANSYDGRVYRNCASAEQCPQGIGCAPITYDEDGTTDYVCCCATPLCNSSPPAANPISMYMSFGSLVLFRLLHCLL